MRKYLCRFLVFIMLFTSTVTNYSYAEPLTADQITREAIINIMEINGLLSEFGMSVDDLRDMPQIPEKLRKEALEFLASGGFIKPDDPASVEARDTWNTSFNDNSSNNSKYYNDAVQTTDMVLYATQMAKKNKLRDPNAKDINKESVYMYMSHYIDVPGGPLNYVNPTLSDDILFSAWITDEDRNAYENYLAALRLGKNFQNGVDTLVNATSVAFSIDDLKEIVDLKNGLSTTRRTIAATSYYLANISPNQPTKENVKKVVASINAASINTDMELSEFAGIISDAVKSNEDLTKELTELGKSIMANVLFNLIITLALSTNASGVLLAMTFGSINIANFAANAVYNRLLYITLTYTARGRAGYRSARYYGLI